MGAIDDATLNTKLAEALPKDTRFQIHHLSTPPSQSSAIYAAPPGVKQEKTFCESHFFSVSIDPGNYNQLQVFALEILIYTTKSLTTLFVSKADSTGYLHLLELTKGTASPLKTISTTILAYLVEKRRRADRGLVVSLFARAQDQYLFPGSIENQGKHVLDDRGLVRWWCRILDPVIRLYPNGNDGSSINGIETKSGGKIMCETSAKGYLRVPGCDTFETKNFFPNQSNYVHPNSYWKVGDPLRKLGRSPHWPERCLIPRFPDDPKARYVDELDDELPETAARTQESPSKGKHPGQWKSVKSLEQFWEMMAFRQECSSGRLVGFIWGVFVPTGKALSDEADSLESSLATIRQQNTTPTLITPRSSQASSSSTSNNKQKREPRTAKELPEKTKYYHWPTSSRGEVVLREKDYQRVNKLMLHLDYATKEIAAGSTRRWIDDVSVMAGKPWGQTIIGKKEPKEDLQVDIEPNSTMLNAGLVRKKKRGNQDSNGHESLSGGFNDKNEVNVLSVGLVRKKPKVAATD